MANAGLPISGNRPLDSHYGAVGRSAGISPEVLFRMAGVAQFVDKTSRKEFGMPWGSPPYGDDLRDEEMMRRGIECYDSVMTQK